MTKTPERYLLKARLVRRIRRAPEMVPCRICGRLYVPHMQQLGCSTSCCISLIQARAKAAG